VQSHWSRMSLRDSEMTNNIESCRET